MNDYDEELHEWLRAQDTDVTGIAHGWIQWKGTDVCMDVHCVCGEVCHVDGEFFYAYKCPACGQVYSVGQNIKLIPVTPEQAAKDHWTSRPVVGE